MMTMTTIYDDNCDDDDDDDDNDDNDDDVYDNYDNNDDDDISVTFKTTRGTPQATLNTQNKSTQALLPAL